MMYARARERERDIDEKRKEYFIVAIVGRGTAAAGWAPSRRATGKRAYVAYIIWRIHTHTHEFLSSLHIVVGWRIPGDRVYRDGGSPGGLLFRWSGFRARARVRVCVCVWVSRSHGFESYYVRKKKNQPKKNIERDRFDSSSWRTTRRRRDGFPAARPRRSPGRRVARFVSATVPLLCPRVGTRPRGRPKRARRGRIDGCFLIACQTRLARRTLSVCVSGIINIIVII